MSSTSVSAAPQTPTDEARTTAAPSSPALLVVFVASVFTSAFLLFLVQPMFGKMVLPRLGGTPSVWNTCMLFFQAALLGGYLYAHLTSAKLGVRGQAALHLALLAAAALLLPLGIGAAAPEASDAPVPWLLGLMLVTVGPPFFVLSGTGPMLQRWFAHSGHPHAADPYWLYGASNLGSMVALLGYPFLLEPRFRLAEQSGVWSAGYALLALLIAASAALVWRRAPSAALAQAPSSHDPASESTATAALDDRPVTWRERATWMALAAVPSSLLLGVTTYLTIDLSPIPLLWVLPLALYLLTFTLVFARRPPVPHVGMVMAQPGLIAVVALLLLTGLVRRPSIAVPLHLGALFVTAMVAHGELARRRPGVRHLTEFYLWIAVGGVVGGAFNVLAAPVLFERTWEYPLVLALACLARPWPEARLGRSAHLRHALFAAVLAGALLLLMKKEVRESLPPFAYVVLSGLAIAALAPALGRTPQWLAACVGLVLVAHTVDEVTQDSTVLAERTFYGHYRVAGYATRAGYPLFVLYHGSTMHGAQLRRPERQREPLTYYVRTGPLGQIFAASPLSTTARRVAVVGLGTGTTAAYAEAGERWTFYEIDPGIERIARDRRYFTYLADAPVESRVVLGDARLSLARAPRGEVYDLILLDAFSSDAIPAHLLTREALEVYLSRLAPGGRIAFHVSNRYLDLKPVVAALARDRGLAARVGAGPARRRHRYEQFSEWVVLARREVDLGALASDPTWKPAQVKPGVEAWTDDYSSLFRIFKG
ncbi:MAG TPA: fused MFS/spermidine synthase [Longimicrobium sp.]|nr:fused MFS/spermidine synthase [Longimicrobium sp.]